MSNLLRNLEKYIFEKFLNLTKINLLNSEHYMKLKIFKKSEILKNLKRFKKIKKKNLGFYISKKLLVCILQLHTYLFSYLRILLTFYW